MEEIYGKLIKYIPEDRVLKNELMSKHTTFKIGGPADIFIKVRTTEELKYIINYTKQNNIPLTIVGNGSNLLVKDNGIRGITIKLDLDNIKVQDDIIYVEAGALLSRLSRIAKDNNLSGLEFAGGIPGTVGGAIKMNAGAYGGEFKDIVIETTYMSNDLEVKTIGNIEQEFSYRHSRFSNTDDMIISTKIRLKKDKKENIEKKMEDNALKRKEKQPINYPNAGSIFKRKNEYIASQIIDKCGLKGYNIGDAYVSELHAGFIINKGNATAKDVIKLIDYIKQVVKEKHGIDLELEIKVLGE